MPGVTYGNKQQTSPRWAQDQLDRHTTTQGGSHLERTEFTLPNADGLNIVYNGTLVGRTWAEKEAGIGYGPADVAADDQIYLLVYDVDFDNSFFGGDGHCSLYRHGSQVRETSLPDWSAMDAATIAKIRSLYEIV